MTYAIFFALSCAHALKLHLLHSAMLLPPLNTDEEVDQPDEEIADVQPNALDDEEL